MTFLLWLIALIVSRPLAEISYPACLTQDPTDADLIAREVQTVAEAKWCVTITTDCKKALFMIYRQPGASESYVVSEACSAR